MIQKVLEQEQVSYRQTIYTPVVTLWARLSQVLDADKSLSNTVSRIVAWLSGAGVEVPSSDTGAESIARFPVALDGTQSVAYHNRAVATHSGEC